jgi:hypothetical protein
MRARALLLVLFVTASCDRDHKASVNEPLKPAGEAQKPAGEAQKPAGEAQKPAGEAQKPAGEAQTPAGKAHPTWSPAGKRWVDSMVKLLPDLFCKDGSYFSTCFTQSAADCRKLAENQTKACLDLHPELVPQEVNADTGRAAGQQLGSCAGGGFENELRKRGKFTDTAHCHDLAYWARVMQEQAESLTNQ